MFSTMSILGSLVEKTSWARKASYAALTSSPEFSCWPGAEEERGIEPEEEEDPPVRSKASLLISSRIPKRADDGCLWKEGVFIFIACDGVGLGALKVNPETHGAVAIAVIAILSFILKLKIDYY